MLALTEKLRLCIPDAQWTDIFTDIYPLNYQIYNKLGVCAYLFSGILMINHEITMSQKRFMTVLFTAYIIPDAQWDWLIYLQNSVVLRRKYEVEPTNHGQKKTGQSPLGCPVGR